MEVLRLTGKQLFYRVRKSTGRMDGVHCACEVEIKKSSRFSAKDRTRVLINTISQTVSFLKRCWQTNYNIKRLLP